MAAKAKGQAVMAKAGKSFKYQARSKDDIKARANQSSGSFASIFKSQYKKYKI